MSNSVNIETGLETVGRQLHYLTKELGHSFQDALAKVKGEHLDNNSLAILQAIADSTENPNLPPKSPYQMLNKLVKMPEVSDNNIPATTLTFNEVYKDFRQQVMAYCLSLKNTIFYSAVLVVVGLFLVFLYHVRILPSFIEIQQGQLPAFASFMSGPGMVGVYVILSLGLVFTAALYWAFRSMMNSANGFTPIQNWVASIVFVKNIVQAVNENLLIAYAAVLSTTDMDDKQVLEKAQAICSTKKQNQLLTADTLSTLQLSQNLGTLQFELKHQLDTASEKLAKQLVSFRTGINVGFQICIFTVISLVIVSFYVLLVSFGSAIG